MTARTPQFLRRKDAGVYLKTRYGFFRLNAPSPNWRPLGAGRLFTAPARMAGSLEDGGELAAACHACLTFYGAQMLEFGPWHDDDDEPPWFCTFQVAEGAAKALIADLRCLSC